MDEPLPESSIHQDVIDLRLLAEGLSRAEAEGNAAFIESVLAPDVVIMAPGIPAIEGAPACLEFMRFVLDENAREFDRHLTYEVSEVSVDRDMGFDWGHFSQALTPKNGDHPFVESGQYLRVYGRGGDGRWKLRRVIWNTLGPLEDGKEESPAPSL